MITILQNHVRATVELSAAMIAATPLAADGKIVGSDHTRQSFDAFVSAVNALIDDCIINPTAMPEFMFVKPGTPELLIQDRLGVVADRANYLERSMALDAKVLKELNGMMTVLAEEA